VREGRDRESGQLCREFVQDISVGGRTERGWGIACRQDDGSWQVVQR
jgi:surface antigen